jgi:predicted membrane chloride channel (bestrophin family)
MEQKKMQMQEEILVVLVSWLIYIPLVLVIWFVTKGSYVDLIVTFLAALVITFSVLGFRLFSGYHRAWKRRKAYWKMINERMQILAKLEREVPERKFLWCDVFKTWRLNEK